MMYALMGLAGLRHGEIAGLRWRNYDPTREPLGKLVVARSSDHATTKSKRPREVPVHATLAKLLTEWKAKGCTEILGRAPEPDDLLVPSRERDMRSRHHMRDKLLEDLERLGLRARRGHDLRRTFITLARADGARADLLEMITHAPWRHHQHLHVDAVGESVRGSREAEHRASARRGDHPAAQSRKCRKPGTSRHRAYYSRYYVFGRGF
jgi:integrase